ncbi:MAG: DEAD/DEAH box helicase [Candidatus Nanoarchaeia archaeon]|nr:DEAD/DEAH box helicase [Candidatus Nanoarchaeia archaeon]
MEKFARLGLSSEILSVLELKGFHQPTEIQEKAIPLALAGKDIIGSSATGSGKTLAFASPIIENLKSNGTVQALILTPTRELAEQDAESIQHFSKNKKLNVAAVYGGVDIQRQIRNIPRADILVGTPGRILDHLQRRTLRLDCVKFLVLDEVDRMLDMGFRYDVERIIKQCPTERQTMLFSATISADFDYLARKFTKNPEEISAVSFVDNSKMKQIFYDVSQNQKFSLLVHLLKQENSDITMIFCSTRRNTDVIARNLNDAGIRARAIHGGLAQNRRLSILKEFHEGRFNVLVCTDVAARGLDIKEVTHVYNYDLPKDSKDYIHRIGRTARAGKDGKVVNIVSNRDYENFGNVLREKSLQIDREELPAFEEVAIRMSSGRHESGGYDRGERNFSQKYGRFNGNRGGGNRGQRRFGNRDSRDGRHRDNREGGYNNDNRDSRGDKRSQRGRFAIRKRRY